MWKFIRVKTSWFARWPRVYQKAECCFVNLKFIRLVNALNKQNYLKYHVLGPLIATAVTEPGVNRLRQLPNLEKVLWNARNCGSGKIKGAKNCGYARMEKLAYYFPCVLSHWRMFEGVFSQLCKLRSSLIWRRSHYRDLGNSLQSAKNCGSGKIKDARNCGYARKGNLACAVLPFCYFLLLRSEWAWTTETSVLQRQRS